MQNYKELKVWHKSHTFTLKVYEATASFPKEEMYGLTTQLRRCAVSIPANIAEGSGKNTPNDFGNFLNIALGSTNEAEYYLLLAKDLTYLNDALFEILYKCVNEIKAMLISLIAKVRGGNTDSQKLTT